MYREKRGTELTFVVPVDAGDLDFLCGDVLFHKFLALQSMPQSSLASVSVTPDHNLHWGKDGQREKINQSYLKTFKVSHPFHLALNSYFLR